MLPLPWTRTLLFGILGHPRPMNGARARPAELKERSLADRNRCGARAPFLYSNLAAVRCHGRLPRTATYPARGPRKGPPGSRYKKTRQRPTLPLSCPSSTIGTSGLNFRVRNGNGCFPAVMVTGILIRTSDVRDRPLAGTLPEQTAFFCLDKLYGQASRSISTG
jgi:hypothetical protein